MAKRVSTAVIVEEYECGCGYVTSDATALLIHMRACRRHDGTYTVRLSTADGTYVA